MYNQTNIINTKKKMEKEYLVPNLVTIPPK